MNTKLIRLVDEIYVEVDNETNTIQQISGSLAEKAQSSLMIIKPIINKVCQPVIDACNDIKKTTDIEKIEIEIGLSFEVEGNVYIAKSKSNANLKVKIVIKPHTTS